MTNKRQALIVEDDTTHLEFIAEIVRRLGFDVSTAASAEEAFERLGVSGRSVDLALLDMQLPKEDGVAVLKRLRGKYPKVKVIVITSFPDEYAKACEKGEVDGYLKKPAGIAELTRRISEVFKAEGSTVVYPTAIVKPLDRHGQVASARILFLSAPYYSKFIRGIIPDITKEEQIGKPCYGFYQVQEVHDMETSREILKQKQTDLLIATSHVYWGPDLDGTPLSPSDFIMEALHSEYCPKEILFLACYQEEDIKKEMTDLEKQGLSVDAMHRLPNWHYQDILDEEGDVRLMGNTLKIAAAIEEACFRHSLSLPAEEVRRRFHSE